MKSHSFFKSNSNITSSKIALCKSRLNPKNSRNFMNIMDTSQTLIINSEHFKVHNKNFYFQPFNTGLEKELEEETLIILIIFSFSLHTSCNGKNTHPLTANVHTHTDILTGVVVVAIHRLFQMARWYISICNVLTSPLAYKEYITLIAVEHITQCNVHYFALNCITGALGYKHHDVCIYICMYDGSAITKANENKKLSNRIFSLWLLL